jgi:alkylation response protein AidB-like acyl-CoA dehydrogenase
MSHFLNEDQRALKESVHSFVSRILEPAANEIDHSERTPAKVTKGVAELGLFGLCIPEQYGGSGQNVTTACMVLEELAKASPAFAGLVSVQMVLCPIAVMTAGNEEQKRRLLPGSASGEKLIAYSQTEAAGAANVADHQTKLTRDGKNWRLNGSKLFCTQGEAKTYLVMCRTMVEGDEGYGCVIVERDAPGFSVDPYEDKLGWRGTNTGGISFTDVLVRPEDILGSLKTGGATDHWAANEASFIGHAATSLGAAQGLFDKTVAYLAQRTLYGAPMSQISPIASWIAEIYTKLEAMRSLLYTYARLYDEGQTAYPMLGSVCKAYVCEEALFCTNRLLQMWGGSGMMNKTGVNRYMRDARVNTVAEGATEMHYSFITQAVLGRGNFFD